MKIEQVVKKHELACGAVLRKFLEIYFCDAETEIDDIEVYPVGGEIGGVYHIGDYFVGFHDMLTCLRMKIPEKTFFAWYDHALECAMEEKAYANLENYYRMTKNTL